MDKKVLSSGSTGRIFTLRGSFFVPLWKTGGKRAVSEEKMQNNHTFITMRRIARAGAGKHCQNRAFRTGRCFGNDSYIIKEIAFC